jgi:hypothetical protein
VSQYVKPVASMAGRPFLHLLEPYVRFHSANLGVLRSAGDNIRMRWKMKYRYIFCSIWRELFFNVNEGKYSPT